MPSTKKSIIASTEQACQAYHDVSIDQQHSSPLRCFPSLCFAMLGDVGNM